MSKIQERLKKKLDTKIGIKEMKNDLDKYLLFVRMDKLNDQDIGHLFLLLDNEKRYEDIFLLIIMYPKTISHKFETLSKKQKLNVQYDWDFDLSKFTRMTKDEYLQDIKNLLESNTIKNGNDLVDNKIKNGKLSRLLSKSISKN